MLLLTSLHLRGVPAIFGVPFVVDIPDMAVFPSEVLLLSTFVLILMCSEPGVSTLLASPLCWRHAFLLLLGSGPAVVNIPSALIVTTDVGVPAVTGVVASFV